MNKFMTADVFVSPLVNIHTHRLNSNVPLQVLSQDLSVLMNLNTTDYLGKTLVSVGLHPMYLSSATTFAPHFMLEMMQRYLVVAIGESGLDKNAPVSIEQQVHLFREQAAFAAEHHLPVIIHCVGRWNELELLFKERSKKATPWIIHGFRKTQLAEKFLRLGAFISIGAALMHDARLQQCVQSLPLERLFLETDDATIELIQLYEKLAAIKSLPLPAIREQLYNNYRSIFHHDELA